MSDVGTILARHSDKLLNIAFDDIFNDLRVEGIIQHHEYFEIVKKKEMEKSLFLQQRLLQRGDNAFPTFLKILRDRNFRDLASLLETGESCISSILRTMYQF